MSKSTSSKARTTADCAVLRVPGTVEIEEIHVSQPGPGEAVLRVNAVGICGSDLQLFEKGSIGGLGIDLSRGRHVLGHEAVAVIEDVGPGVDRRRVGERVAVEPAINCGMCPWCLAGAPNVCPNHQFLGSPPCDGALRRYMVHPARLCVAAPSELNDDDVVMLEPLAIAVHALDRIGLSVGQPAVVLGSGPLGLCVTALLSLDGCHPIIVTDKLDYRLERARALGATHTFNPDRDNVVEGVHQLTDGKGSPYVFEAAGDPQTLWQMVECACPTGRVAAIGISADDRVTFQHSVARRKGLDILMIRRANRTLERAITLAVHRGLTLSRLVTHHWPLARVQEAFQTSAAYADGVVKGIINP